MGYEILDVSKHTLVDVIEKIKSKFVYSQNDTIFLIKNGKFIKRINYELFSNAYPNITNEFFNTPNELEHDFSYSYNLDENDKLINVFLNKDYNSNFNLLMNKNRWDILYKNNNDVINFIKRHSINKIIVTGDFGKYIYYYIKKYGTDIDVKYVPNNNYLEIDEKYKGYTIIDSNGESNYLRGKLISNNRYYSLIDFCNLVETDIFNINFLQEHQDNFIFVKVTTNPEKYTNLTDDEKERCKKSFIKPYRYKDYLKDANPKTRELVKLFYREYYDETLIEDVCFPAQFMMINGLLKQKEINNPNFHVYNGKRKTKGESKINGIDINFYGTCLVYGQMVSDQNTIHSYFYDLLDNEIYSVHNLGIPNNMLTEIIRTINKQGIKNNSLNIIFYLDNEEKIFNQLNSKNQIDLTSTINDSLLDNTILDNILHCNQNTNQLISNCIYKHALDKIKIISRKSDEEIKVFTHKDLYTNNKVVKRNIEMLEKFKRKGNNGAIVLHGNPFTNGHYELVKYASNMVDTLYVFVLQEDRGIFKFEDRIQMAQESCKNFENVVVLPSGEFFGSAMLFAEYGEKTINETIKVDSLDDTEFFCEVVADILNIKKRFVGEEEYDMVTNHLNNELKRVLPKYNIECIEVPRFKSDGIRISAHMVRTLIENDNFDELQSFIPLPVLEIIYNKKYPEIIKNNKKEDCGKQKILKNR